MGNIGDYETRRKADKARQRWKILCLVRTSDPVADETARQERVQERVDDWMRTMVSKLQIDDREEDENIVTLKTNGGKRLSVASNEMGGTGTPRRRGSCHLKDDRDLINADTSKLITKVPKVSEREKIESLSRIEDQRKKKEMDGRIKAREKAEWERERQMILEGKMKMRREHLKDPVLKLHYDMQKLKKKASKGTASTAPKSPRIKPKKKSSYASSNVGSNASDLKKTSITSCVPAGAYKPAIRSRWSKAMNRLKANSILEKSATTNGYNGDIDGSDSDLELDPKIKKKKPVKKFSKKKPKAVKNQEPPAVNHNRTDGEVETVVAQLVYDEKNDKLISAVADIPATDIDARPGKNQSTVPNGNLVNGEDEEREVEKKKEKIKRINPIFEAFDDAEGVDDLYRIAEFYVQPTTLYDL